MEKDKNQQQNLRILELYQMLQQGKALHKKHLAEQYQVSEKTIQRDIECLRTFFAEHSDAVIHYKRGENQYILETQEKNSDETADMVVRIGRILYTLEPTEHPEYREMVEWLLMQVPPDDRCSVMKKIQQI